MQGLDIVHARMIFIKFCMLTVYLAAETQTFSIPSYGYYRKDADIQNSLVGIALSLNRSSCPVVIIHDDVLPEPALNRMLTEFKVHSISSRSPSFPAPIFIILDLAPPSLNHYFAVVYNTTNPVEIILKFLHTLYRRSECYTFIIWIRDPKILELTSSTTIHPGWRENDVVLLPSHHTSKLYKSLTKLKFWNDIPNIIGLKRKYDGEFLASNEIRIYTVIPYYSKKRLQKSQELDVWLVSEKKFLFNRRLFFDKFVSFNGASLLIGVYWKEPFLIWGNADDPYLDGLDWRLLGLCRKQLNFTFNIKHTFSYGRKHEENGTWTGMMGLLRNNTINFGIGGVAMYSDLMEAFGFTKPYYTDSFSFISPLSTTTSSSWNALIFQSEVWKAATFTLIASTIALKAVAEMENKLHRNLKGELLLLKDHKNSRHFTKTANVLGFIITVLCQKPYKHNPKRLSVQLIFYGIILGNFIMGIVFSGCLIAYLFQFKHKPLADKLADILTSGVQVNVESYDGYLDYFMETSKDPIIKSIYKMSTPVHRTGSDNNSTSSVDDVVCGKSVHIDSVSRLKFTGKYRYKGAKGLKFYLSSENIIDHVDVGWPVRKNWPFMKKFDDIINRAVENGFVQHWMKRLTQGHFGWDDEAWKIPELFTSYLQRRNQRVKDIDPSLVLARRFIPLSTSHLNGVICLYVGGIILSGIIFLGEIIFSFVYRTGKNVWERTLRNESKIHSKTFTNTKMELQKNKEKLVKLGYPTGKRFDRQSRNEPNEPFKIKIKKLSAMESHYANIVWSDFDQCHDKLVSVKLGSK